MGKKKAPRELTGLQPTAIHSVRVRKGPHPPGATCGAVHELEALPGAKCPCGKATFLATADDRYLVLFLGCEVCEVANG